MKKLSLLLAMLLLVSGCGNSGKGADLNGLGLEMMQTPWMDIAIHPDWTRTAENESMMEYQVGDGTLSLRPMGFIQGTGQEVYEMYSDTWGSAAEVLGEFQRHGEGYKLYYRFDHEDNHMQSVILLVPEESGENFWLAYGAFFEWSGDSLEDELIKAVLDSVTFPEQGVS